MTQENIDTHEKIIKNLEEAFIKLEKNRMQRQYFTVSPETGESIVCTPRGIEQYKKSCGDEC